VIPRRFRKAFWVSVGSSIACFLLATAHNIRGGYDPTLAVLTATLIAIVWYTFFTYCAIHREESSRLKVSLDRLESDRQRFLALTIANSTAERVINFRIRLEVIRNGAKLEAHPVFSMAEEFTLHPGHSYEGVQEISPALAVEGSKFGPGVQLGEPERFYSRLTIAWSDDLGEVGVIGPQHYSFDVRALTRKIVYVRTQLDQAFGKFPPAPIPRL
jgi:hypothetical protein